MIRLLALLLLLGSLGSWLQLQQAQGRFQQVDRSFLDVLLANARDRFVPDPTAEPQVVYLPLREADKAEYSAWPPQPVDYQMILKGAASFSPSVVVIVDPLAWPSAPEPPLVAELAETLLPLPSVVLTTRSNGEPSGPEALMVLGERLSAIELAQGTPAKLPKAKASSAPLPALCRQGDPALLSAEAQDLPEMVCYDGTAVRPSPALQGLMHAAQVPMSQARLVLDGGAALLLGSALYLPLREDGRLPLLPAQNLLEHNALDLMTVGMVEDASGELAKKLARGKVLVLGMESATDDVAKRQALALAQIMAIPRLQSLGDTGQVIASAVAGLIGLSLLWLPRARALGRAFLYLLLALIGSFLAFQMSSVWLPPSTPAAILLAAGFFVRFFGRQTSTADNHG